MDTTPMEPKRIRQERSSELKASRNAWLFAGSEVAGKGAATVMSLVQPASTRGRDLRMYLRDVLTGSPFHPTRDIDALLPHRWTPSHQG